MSSFLVTGEIAHGDFKNRVAVFRFLYMAKGIPMHTDTVVIIPITNMCANTSKMLGSILSHPTINPQGYMVNIGTIMATQYFLIVT